MNGRTIAVGDLGEFLYGNYKEPFTQLEGAIPGYPRGVLLVDRSDEKLLCPFCGKTYHRLEFHVRRKHGMTATEFKDEVGLLRKSALISEPTRRSAQANGLRQAALGHRLPSSAKGRWNGNRNHPNGRQTEEFKNRKGSCYLQTLTVAREVARTGAVTHARLRAHGVWSDRVERYFGSIDNLRRMLGQENPRIGRKRGMTKAQIITALQSIARQLGRPPTLSDCRRFDFPSDVALRHHFGTRAEAYRQAGLPSPMPVRDEDWDARVLLAVASAGTPSGAAQALRTHQDQVASVLARYGYPYTRSDSAEVKRAWATEMAARLAA